MQAFPRGSEWRKWDLQVHTPYSALNNGFGSDFDAYARTLLTRAVAERIAAIAVTDYFSIQGYVELRRLLADHDRLVGLLGTDVAEAAGRLLILPNVELRTSTIVRDPDGRDSRVNFHIIFSDEIHPDVVEEDFLRQLRFTAESSPDSVDNRMALTTRNLEALGARLKREHAPFQDRSDLIVGQMNAVVNHELVSSVLHDQEAKFEGRYLLVVPADEDLSACSWDGQGHLARKLLIQKSHMLYSSNLGTHEFGLGRRHPTTTAFINEFKTLKPCVHGSDAHSPDELFRPALGRQLWIKADPTFNGLRQVVNEPEERVYIGMEPPILAHIAARPTRVITALRISKVAGSSLDEQWFDVDLQINPELVTVIGDKGSGKSALTDVLGLLGSSPNSAFMSFLSPKRFRDPKRNKARHFAATLTWADGSVVGPTSLDSVPDPAAPETILYIPQGYLEEICNETSLGSGSRFYGELQRVIFSHIPVADRQGFATLEDLLRHRGAEVARIVATLSNELHELNSAIVDTEAALLPQRRRRLELALIEMRRELEAHNLQMPAEVPKPEEDTASKERSARDSALLQEAERRLAALEDEIRKARERDAGLARKITAAERLIDGLRNLRHQFDTFMADSRDAVSDLGLDAAALVSFTIDDAPLRALVNSMNAERASLKSALDGSLVDSLEARHKDAVESVRLQQEALSAPQRVYQSYLTSLREWQAGVDRLNGAPDAPGTIRYLEDQVRLVDALPAKLERLRRKRERKAAEILREKLRLRGYYRAYYAPIYSHVTEHPLSMSGQLRMTFEVALTETGLADGLLKYVDQRKAGPFYGLAEGAAAAKDLVASIRWDSILGPIRFTRLLLRSLEGSRGTAESLQDQLKPNASTLELYDYLFSFGFLEPIYKLTWDGRDLEQLSPGERGNLLLVFYLLLDKGDIPLVLDQPEENLDNRSVVRTLVPCMKEAKKRRQVLIVTHNPNLAVVCDADQVIRAEIDREHGNAVTYLSGSIENPPINRIVVDVLEGTRPAFDIRDAKYLPYRAD